MDDCSNRAALLGEERLLGSLAPCLFFNFGGRDACCASAQDLLANDTADAELDLELCKRRAPPGKLRHFIKNQFPLRNPSRVCGYPSPINSQVPALSSAPQVSASPSTWR